MIAAADVTPSSPQRKSNITGAHAMNAKTTSDMKSGNSQSSQPTGDGGQSAIACAFCGTTLANSQVYCCTACEVTLMLDPNYRLSGESDD
ncbi:protein NinF [Pantoea stewartii]|uniref:protein NinF n=1 Tax=Pantoea stewartii TaxID=66269 RepID=UPI0019819FCE|nr:protein NinF [Pantoea stewartii]